MSSSSSPTTPAPTHCNGSTNSSPSPIDTLFLQNLMSRMQLRPPFLDTNSYLTSPLDDFLLSDLAFLSAAASDSDSDDNISDISSLADDLADDPDEGISDSNKEARRRRMVAKEEAKLEKEIVRLVHSGNSMSALLPNSGQSVAVGDHHVCVGVHEDSNGEYRVWEWHGHVMLFDDEEGYSAEYIYGNYFERLGDGGRNAFLGKKKEVNKKKSRRGEVEEEEEEMEKDGSLGLRDLIIGDGGGSNGASSSVTNGGGRVVHRNHGINAGSAAAASAAR